MAAVKNYSYLNLRWRLKVGGYAKVGCRGYVAPNCRCKVIEQPLGKLSRTCINPSPIWPIMCLVGR